MPIKKHFFYQVRYFLQALYSNALPEWIYSRLFRSSLIALCIIFGSAHIIQMSRASVTGYQIRSLEKKIDELAREQQKLEVAVMEKTSLVSLHKRLDTLQLVPAKKIIKLEEAPNIAMKIVK